MLDVKNIIKILKSYNITSTYFGPSIYKNENNIGICLEIKDSTFGFLTRYFTFDNTTELENMLKKMIWFKKNGKKHNIALSLDNYEMPNPSILFIHNKKVLELPDMENFESNIKTKKIKKKEDSEAQSYNWNIEGLTNYLINLKKLKTKIIKEKNDLKIKEGELRYELMQNLTIYYGNNKAITKNPVNIEIVKEDNDIEFLQDNLNIIKNKTNKEKEEYLQNLINSIKSEELDDKYYINIYSKSIYEYNINILNKQIEFVKRKIEAEKNFNLKGSKIHNIDAELKSFLKTGQTPMNINNFLEESKRAIINKYAKIKDIKNAYSIISNEKLNLPEIKIEEETPSINVLENLKQEFDNLEENKKAYFILYNSFYKDICNELIQNINLTKDDLDKKYNIKENFKYMEEYVFNENNTHYLSKYFKYLNFKNIDTYINSIKEIAKIVKECSFKIKDSLTVFCEENMSILSTEPIYNTKEKVYIVTLPKDTNLIYIPDKIIIDEETKEMSIISTENIYINKKIIDSEKKVTVNQYQKITEKDPNNDIIITKELKLRNTYIFNIGVLEGEL